MKNERLPSLPAHAAATSCPVRAPKALQMSRVTAETAGPGEEEAARVQGKPLTPHGGRGREAQGHQDALPAERHHVCHNGDELFPITRHCFTRPTRLTASLRPLFDVNFKSLT